MIFLFSVFSLLGQTLTDAEILDQIRQKPCRAACGHSPYEVPNCRYTAAPEGYKAFYVSHFGRHGSRYQTSDKAFDILKVMDSLSMAGLLTPQGDSIYVELRRIVDAHKDHYSLLTSRGSGEQRGIASRLATREAEIFRRPDANNVVCTSTDVPRVIQSMANFGTALKGSCSALNITYDVGLAKLPRGLEDEPGISGKERGCILKPLSDSLVKAYPYGEEICKRFVKDSGRIGNTGSNKFVFSLLDALQGYACLDIDVNPFRFFTVEELAKYAEQHNLRFAFSYGGMMESSPRMMHKADRLLRAIIRDADAALEGNGRCADFRFGHDGNIGPLISLIAPAGSVVDVPMSKSYLQWQSWNRICMATNLQMVFYRNKAGNVLVKLLLNEKEAEIPALNAVSDVFYEWKSLRDHLLKRVGDLKALPEYWDSTIFAKSALIRDIQKNEVDGFFFFTDTHYPKNAGNTAPVICAVNSALSIPRRAIFGGDMSTYTSDYSSGIVPNFQVMQQVRGSAGFYPLRGNHDVMIDSKTNVMEQWDVATVFKDYTSEDAVYNKADETACYYYLDNPSANIRYVFFDTTDSVHGGSVVYGMSPKQIKWIVEDVVLKAPRGCKFVFLGHVPFISEKKRGTEEVASLVRAINSHSIFEYRGTEYDLSQRKDVSVLFMLSGHLHRDLSFFQAGVPQILTTCDSYFKNPEMIGTVAEQAIDYISISKDLKKVTLIRLGRGKDRVFEL